jgi:phytase-like protein
MRPRRLHRSKTACQAIDWAVWVQASPISAATGSLRYPIVGRTLPLTTPAWTILRSHTLKIDIKTGKTWEYAYQLDTATKTTVSDILAINDHEFLVDERDSKGRADKVGSAAVFKKPFITDLQFADDVTDLTGAASRAPYTVAKRLDLPVRRIPAHAHRYGRFVKLPLEDIRRAAVVEAEYLIGEIETRSACCHLRVIFEM